ncbi:hypothetical protein [sulfur-oxidizing endosymbiont of Gigantopelta aegis]|uniref:hypothetical protein n=1 Tax=sulfur-oxidizing endosymbiont of Gigantopelta aegis TaxID=2794934 RepID=UPI0018DB4C6C|nr:hypothetical protein [sulfur-oxidizing endosymbiont of Gigantopelta aegis]
MTQTFKEAFYFFRSNVLKILTYTFAIGLLVLLIAQLLIPVFFDGVSAEEINQESIRPFAQLMNLVIQPIYTGGLIVLIYSLAKEQGKGVLNSLYAGVLRWPYMLLANVITSFIIFGGLLLFVLPGIWLFSRLFLVPYLVILKNKTPFEAIIDSFKLTKGYSLTILIDIIILVMLFVVGFVFINLVQLANPIILLAYILIFQSMAYVLYYRHYEILIKSPVELEQTD